MSRARLVPFAMIAISACSKNGTTSAKHFNCEKTPFMDQPERQCSSDKSCTPETCFYPDHAYCFFYSTSWKTVEMKQRADAFRDHREFAPTPHTGTWSDKTLPMCTPTLEECNSFRDGVGKPNDQPPVKTPCRDTPAEQDPMTAPLPF